MATLYLERDTQLVADLAQGDGHASQGCYHFHQTKRHNALTRGLIELGG
jgi:hypothetical protein